MLLSIEQNVAWVYLSRCIRLHDASQSYLSPLPIIEGLSEAQKNPLIEGLLCQSLVSVLESPESTAIVRTCSVVWCLFLFQGMKLQKQIKSRPNLTKDTLGCMWEVTMPLEYFLPEHRGSITLQADQDQSKTYMTRWETLTDQQLNCHPPVANASMEILHFDPSQKDHECCVFQHLALRITRMFSSSIHCQRSFSLWTLWHWTPAVFFMHEW